MALRRADTIAQLNEVLHVAQRDGQRVACVPTMGALHAGHTSLLDRARAECDVVVATLFVNPLQFDRADDLAKYPRNANTDLAICERHGTDVLFSPTPEVMYPGPKKVTVDVTPLEGCLCGATRPGHFRGVATVVTKLLNIVAPQRAYFGEKDFQQLVIIATMARELNLDVEIVGCETVRDDDGLALSSRNALLDPVQRAVAPLLATVLRDASAAVAAGERDASKLIAEARTTLNSEPQFESDYVEVVDPATLEPVSTITGTVRIAAAAYLGSARLTDNVAASPLG
ncbi:pantoate--beta-alanine ligase [Candidatus Poriferisodalis sp.]|uniref:pantoate--beta-alanine ligase n=1 Tax=Candidatus Poriferisodalis sp. TaxID=3101277 RepID=UPI003D0FB67A